MNYAKFTSFLKDSAGKITGVEFIDKVTGKIHKVNSKIVVNATGNFSDSIRKIDDPKSKRRIFHALGTHIMLDSSFCSRDMGILIPKTSDGRVLFVVPWLHSTTVGTTDIQQKEAVIHPTPTPQCMEFLTKEIANLYPILKDKNVNDYIKSKWSGIRPLILEEETNEELTETQVSGKNLARTHKILESDSGLISVIGGKWTIYRRMGEETLQLIMSKKGEKDYKIPEELSTRNLRFIGDVRKGVHGIQTFKGSSRKDHKEYSASLVRSLYLRHASLGLPLLNHLARSYGLRSLDILEMIGKDPALCEKIHPSYEITKAEIIYQIRNEMVVNIFDILLRRNRIAFESRQDALSVMPNLIDILGNEFKWDTQTKKKNFEEAKELFTKMEF